MGEHGDDDYTFGDFTFASFPSSAFNSHQTMINNVPNLTPNQTGSAFDGDDDDDWSDFVKSPIGSDNQHQQQLQNAIPHTQSKPLDPSGFFPQKNDTSLSELAQRGESGSGHMQKAGWEKPKGPLPLSLFGDVEEEEDKEDKGFTVEDPQGGYGKDSSGKVQNGANNVNLNVGGNDLIANLYSYNSNQQIAAVNNGFVANGNGLNFDEKGVNLSSGLNELSSSSASGEVKNDFNNKDENAVKNEDLFRFNPNGSVWNQKESNLEAKGVNFKEKGPFSGLSLSSASSLNKDLNNNDQKANNEDKFKFNSNGLGLNQNINAGLDISRSSVNISEASTSSSSMFNDQRKPYLGENNGLHFDISQLNSTQNASSPNLSTSIGEFGGWTSGFGGFSSSSDMLNANLNDLTSNFYGLSSESRNKEFDANGDDIGDDDEGWEFKDAFSEAKAFDGVEKADPKTREMSNINTQSSGFESGSNGSIDFFAFSDRSVDLFSMSNGVSSDFGKVGSELNIRPTTAAEISLNSDAFLRSDPTGIKSGSDSHPVVRAADNDEDFGEFTAASAETRLKKEVTAKVHDLSQLNAYASSSGDGSSRAVDLFAFPNKSSDPFSMSDGPSSATIEFGTNFDTIPNTAAQNGFVSHEHLNNEQTGITYGLGPPPVLEGAENNEDFGEFEAAFPETEEKKEREVPTDYPQFNVAEMSVNGKDLVNGMKFQNKRGALPLSIFGDEELEVDNTLNSQNELLYSPSPVQRKGPSQTPIASIDALISNLYSQAPQISSTDTLNVTSDIEMNPTLGVNSDILDDANDFDEGSWEFKDAFDQARAENEKSLDSPEDDNRNLNVTNDTFNVSNDIGLTPTVGVSSGVLDDADEGSWEFKDAFDQARAENKKSLDSPEDASGTLNVRNDTLNVTNDIEVTPTVGVSSGILDDAGDFDEDSWEFKDACGQARAENGKYLDSPEDARRSSAAKVDARQSISSKLALDNHVDFYSKLKDSLDFLIKCHLENSEQAQGTVALPGEDGKAMALDEEIQDACNQRDHELAASREDSSERHPSRNYSVSEFLVALQEQKFQILESEYGLSQKLSLAEKDLRSALELRKHSVTMLKFLRLGSVEDHLAYISIWSKMISACVQELRHGSRIWKQSVEKNLVNDLLSDPEGKKFIQALGEIYRVTMVLGVSIELYKPWTFESCAMASDIYVLLNECNSLWSAGIEEALLVMLHSNSIDDNSAIAALLDSIKCIRDVDLLTLQNHIFIQQESRCQLSLITSESIPGLKVAVWYGKQYFVKLANLWANLISSDPPSVPQLHHTLVDEKAS